MPLVYPAGWLHLARRLFRPGNRAVAAAQRNSLLFGRFLLVEGAVLAALRFGKRILAFPPLEFLDFFPSIVGLLPQACPGGPGSLLRFRRSAPAQRSPGSLRRNVGFRGPASALGYRPARFRGVSRNRRSDGRILSSFVCHGGRPVASRLL